MPTLADFHSFFDPYIFKHRGFVPPNVDLWFDKVEQNKVNIRKLISGHKLQKFYTIASSQSSLPPDQTLQLAKELEQYLPRYFQDYKYDHTIFNNPTIPNGSHNSIKVTKHIRTYAQQFLGKDHPYLKNVDLFLNKLGEAWAKVRSSDCKLEITISTWAKAFVLLGHYGPDEDSCWRQGSNHPHDKYIFGQAKDSFVITIAEFSDKKNKYINSGRCIGFLQDDNTIGISNYYFKKRFQEGNAIGAIRKLFEELWQDVSEFHEGGHVIMDGRNDNWKFYHNAYGNWVLTKGKDSKLDKTVLLKLDPNFILYFMCEICGRNKKSIDAWEKIDDKLCCSSCVFRAYICDISKKKTFEPLIEVIGADEELLSVHQEVAANYEVCKECQQKSINIISINDERMCKECFNLKFTHCDECGEPHLDEEIIFMEDGDFCKNCLPEMASI